jgi:NAD+ kinase
LSFFSFFFLVAIQQADTDTFSISSLPPISNKLTTHNKTAGGTLKLVHPSTQQQLLVWRSRPRSVLVLKRLGEDSREEFAAVVDYLGREQRMLVLVEPHELEKTAESLLLLEGRKKKEQGGGGSSSSSSPSSSPSSTISFLDTYTELEASSLASTVDFVVCLGGDGLVLHASSLFRNAIPPVISFNMGSLGFLTNHSFHEHREALSAVITGRERLESCSVATSSVDGASSSSNDAGVHITLRMRLECQVVEGATGLPRGEPFEVLNEVVVDRGASPYLTKIECWERGRLVTKVQADGVMLATTTGSTAYSVAAGGSMVHPNVPAILFTPICPHSLSFRPVVLPDYAELELRIAGDMRCTAWACFDGKHRRELLRGDAVRVRMSANPVPTISKADSTNDWFDTLNRCFGWNERLEQKPYYGGEGANGKAGGP